MTAPKRARRHLELVGVAGNPTTDERDAIAAALEDVVAAQRRALTPSLWLRAGRAQGRRLGMSDYRDRVGHEDAWRLSIRFPAGGREYPGRVGRGDSR